MELTWIDDFLALERTRNFTRAADARHTTQSAYSRRIMRLEEWLGVKLFERDTRPVHLTPEGNEFLARAQRLRADILDSRRALQSMASRYDAPMRIYTTNTLAVGFFPTWIKTRTDIKHFSLVVASVRGCLEAVRAGKAELAVLPVIGDDVKMWERGIEIVGKDALSVYYNAMSENTLSVSDGLISGNLMMYSPGTAFGALIDAMLAEKHIRVADKPLCESASAEALAAQVRAGMGAAWLPQSLVSAADGCKIVPKTECFDIPYEIGVFGS